MIKGGGSMDLKSLIERSNRWTSARYGITITERKLRDWVDEELVDPPVRANNLGQQAAIYEWTTRSYWQVLTIARMKSFGVATFNQLRVELWLRNDRPVTLRVRDSMVSEYRRLHKEIYRPKRADSLYSVSKKISRPASSQRHISAKTDPQLRPLSERFSELDANLWYGSARFRRPLDLHDFMKNVGRNILGVELEADGSWISSMAVEGIGQITEDGEAHEDSAERSLQEASDNSMQKIRRLSRSLPSLAKLPEVMSRKEMNIPSEITETFQIVMHETGCLQWRFLMFCTFLHLTRRARPPDEALDEMEMGLPMGRGSR